MDFADFVNHIFILERDESKACKYIKGNKFQAFAYIYIFPLFITCQEWNIIVNSLQYSHFLLYSKSHNSTHWFLLPSTITKSTKHSLPTLDTFIHSQVLNIIIYYVRHLPRCLLVCLSNISIASSIGPNCSKYVRTSSMVVGADNPPTNIFFVRVTIWKDVHSIQHTTVSKCKFAQKYIYDYLWMCSPGECNFGINLQIRVVVLICMQSLPEIWES